MVLSRSKYPPGVSCPPGILLRSRMPPGQSTPEGVVRGGEHAPEVAAPPWSGLPPTACARQFQDRAFSVDFKVRHDGFCKRTGPFIITIASPLSSVSCKTVSYLRILATPYITTLFRSACSGGEPVQLWSDSLLTEIVVLWSGGRGLQLKEMFIATISVDCPLANHS